MKAVILSAGQGKRLLPLTRQLPKCLLPLAGRTILEWQIRALAASGVKEVVVVTGFQSEAVDRAIDRMRPANLRVRSLFNPFYAVADNVGSCYVAGPEIAGGTLLLNGDTMFEPGVIARAVAQARHPVTVTVDRKARYDGDDMKVRLEGERLTRIGKTLPAEEVDAESIGVLVFRDEGGPRFVATLGRLLRRQEALRSWYLQAVDMLAAEGAVGAASIEGLAWAEVDFPDDLVRAEAMAAGWRRRLDAEVL